MGEGGPAHVDACGQGEGGQKRDFCGRHKWMAPNCPTRWYTVVDEMSVDEVS